jgi:outer membrane lipopolysaccharide assembly protein LptE/RlpB
MTIRGRLQKWPWLLTALVLAVAVAGCGYHMAGPGELPGKAKSVAVTMLVNRSGESGLEAKVTNALLDEITRRRQDLVVSEGQADVILSGTIDKLSTQTAARKGTLTASERMVVITVSLVLKSRTGEVLWQGSHLTAEQAFPVADTKPQTESNRRAALDEVAKRLAEYAYERLTDNF